VRTSLNLSAIFRAIGIRDHRQAIDTVDLLQPTALVGDYSDLGPPVLAPTSAFGGQGSGIALSIGFFHLRPPPQGGFLKFVGGVFDSGDVPKISAVWEWHVVSEALAIAETTFGVCTNVQIATQPSRAVAHIGTSLGPPTPSGATVNPMSWMRSGSGWARPWIFIRGGQVFEAYVQIAGQYIVMESIFRDAGVDPLPDAELAVTP
jgi:hypothetical protein